MRRGRISRGGQTVRALGFGFAVASVAVPTGVRATVRTTDAEVVRADLRFLSAPERDGRGALTSGLDQAAEFVAARFAAVGLEAAGDRGTFFQAVDIPVPQRASAETRLALGAEPLTLGVDFVPNAGSATTRAGGPLVFVGGDLGGIDVRGKVVLCLLSESVSTSRLLGEAVAHGAVGVLFVDARSAADATTEGLEPLSAFAVDEVSAIASFHVRSSAIDRVLAPRHLTVARLQSALRSGERPPIDLPGWATFAVAWTPSRVRGRNVIGLLRGSDPKLGGEAVVVGAHYDHLGWGEEGGALDGRRLHPGADDNASGTAAMMAVAATLAGAGPRPRRTILFVAFTGEEKGWAGSRALVARAPKTVVAMLNMDMVGRMKGNALEVNGSATSGPWRAIVDGANVAGAGVVDALTLSYPRAVPPGSDHQPFIVKRVPALFLFTGMHCDYHRGSDTWDRINVDGVVKVARLVAGVARSVADRAQRLSFASPTWADRRPPMGCTP
jgi:hypothetical protein